MTTSPSLLSTHAKRNKIYLAFLEDCHHSKMTVNDIIHMGYRLMRQAKLHPHFFGNNTLLENAEYLAFFALKLPYQKNNLNLHITANNAEKIIALFEKRISEKIPVEYITHEAFYLNYQFYVNEHVLVPRSVMNTRFHDFLNNIDWENNSVLDLCAGSGCVGISLALLNPDIKVDLVDISPDALKVAAINIEKYGLQNRVRCIQSNLFSHVKHKYDLIITNPPYVSISEYNKSHAEFKKEPKLALESGWDGLALLHQILTQAKSYLNPRGKMIAEVGISAARRLKRRYPNISFKWLKYRKPNGKQPLFAMDCIFECEAKSLQNIVSPSCYGQENWLYRFIDRLRDEF